jgi:hypothetical protein
MRRQHVSRMQMSTAVTTVSTLAQSLFPGGRRRQLRSTRNRNAVRLVAFGTVMLLVNTASMLFLHSFLEKQSITQTLFLRICNRRVPATTTTTTTTAQFPTIVHLHSVWKSPTNSAAAGYMPPAPPPLKDMPHSKPDYGSIKISLQLWHGNEPNATIESIEMDANVYAERYRLDLLEQMDAVEADNDSLLYDELEINASESCQTPTWSFRSYPVCNVVHEVALERSMNVEPHVTFLGSGYFRDSWHWQWHGHRTALGTPPPSSVDQAVLKQYRYEHTVNADAFRMIRTEAVVMEALTAAPSIGNVYGYCATSLWTEFAHEITKDIVPWIPSLQPNGRGRMAPETLRSLEERNGFQPYPLNNLTATTKLDLAIAMAQGLAELHGMPNGVIVHDDVHPDQWLRTDDNRIVLNDLNNAVFLPWNSDPYEYCPYYSRYTGDFRAPEEYADDTAYVDERYILCLQSRGMLGVALCHSLFFCVAYSNQRRHVAHGQPHLQPLDR